MEFLENLISIRGQLGFEFLNFLLLIPHLSEYKMTLHISDSPTLCNLQF